MWEPNDENSDHKEDLASLFWQMRQRWDLPKAFDLKSDWYKYQLHRACWINNSPKVRRASMELTIFSMMYLFQMLMWDPLPSVRARINAWVESYISNEKEVLTVIFCLGGMWLWTLHHLPLKLYKRFGGCDLNWNMNIHIYILRYISGSFSEMCFYWCSSPKKIWGRFDAILTIYIYICVCVCFKWIGSNTTNRCVTVLGSGPWWFEFLIQTSWLHLRSLTASLPLKTDDWKAILSYWDSVTFQGLHSGKLTWQWNQDEFPIENGDIPAIAMWSWNPEGMLSDFRGSRSRLVSSRCIFPNEVTR